LIEPNNLIINKRIALAAVICNLLYSAICIARFIHTQSQIIIDFSKGNTIPLDDNSLWYIIPQILYVFIFAGLLLVLNIFQAKFWIRLSVIVFVSCKIITLIIIHLTSDRFLISNNILFQIINIANFLSWLYLLVAFILVKTPENTYFKIFAVLTVFSIALPALGGMLYDHMGIHWLLLNRDFMSQLCFMPTLILFIKMLSISYNTRSNIIE